MLFLDELPEFGAHKLDTLRQPLEEGEVRLGRARGFATFPARFLCVAAMNPCPCGQWRPEAPCGCSPLAVERYAGRVSGPLRDRFDLKLALRAVPVRELQLGRSEAPAAAGPTSAELRARVIAARQRQLARQGVPNAELGGAALRQHAGLGGAEARELDRLADRYRLSARQVVRLLRLARTAADLEGAERVGAEHLAAVLALQRGARLPGSEVSPAAA
ncbi:MAG: hypothetical protein KatS3mg102_1019 [Planctomycetota bacterium]|nr:MAG: hypothetical protein KatS3mg102_1019 [Planctomycetota bacterium]